MSRSTVDLDRIAVASPCPVAWDDMAGNDRARFCNQCGLNVYNISAMTKQEAESFIANAEGRICAKFYRRADGTILTRDCPVGLRAVRKKVSRAAAAAFSALISLFGGSATFAQERQPKDDGKVDIQRTLRREGQAAIEGTVFDGALGRITGARVKLINNATKQEIITETNSGGNFRFPGLEKGVYTIQVSAEGFISLEQSGLEVSDEQVLNRDVTLRVGGELVGVLVVDKRHSGKLKRKDRPRE
jgi:hypothetical protein